MSARAETILSRREVAGFLLALLAMGWLLYPSEYTRGLMHREQGDRSHAIAFFTDYLKRHPYHKGATLALASAYEAAGRPEDAIPLVTDFYRHRRGDLQTGQLLLGLLERADRLAEAARFRWELVEDLRALPKPPEAELAQLLYGAFQEAASRQDDDGTLKALTALAEISTASDAGGYRGEMLRLLMARRKLGAAVGMLREAARKDPGNVDLRRTLARVLLLDGRADEALRELEAALKLKPGDVGIVVDRAEIYARQKRWDLAENEYRRLMTIQPHEAAWPRELGRSLIQRGRFREGIKYYELLANRDPGDREAAMAVVYAYADRGDHAAAARKLEQRLRAHPDDDEAFDLMIFEYQSAGMPDRALAALAKRVSARPDDAARRLALAQLLVDDERYDEAEVQYQALVKLRPSEKNHWIMLAFIEQTQHRYGEAAATLQDYLARNPKDGQAVEALAGVYLQLGQREKAIGVLRSYLGPLSGRAR